MEDFMSTNGLSHLLTVFAEHNIDSIDLLADLTKDHNVLTMIIPKIGDRLKFIRGVRELQIQQAPIDIVDDFVLPPAKRPRATSSPLLEPVLEENICTNFILQIPDSVNLNLSEPPTQTSSGVSTLHGEQSASTITNLDNSDCGLNSSFLSYCPTQVATDFNLKDVLNSDIVGRAILSKYNNKFTLDARDRNIICDIIISHFLNQSYKLNNESLSIIANKIVDLFPASEKRTTYFVSPVPKRRSGRNKPEIARGKLVDKHRNKLTAVRRALQFQVIIESKGEGPENLTEAPSQTENDSKIWLVNNTEPVEEVLKHWKLSYPIRRITSETNNNKTIEQFYHEWPILETQIAIELITSDFQKAFNKEGISEETFQNFFDNLLRVRLKNLSAADQTILELLDGNITTDSKVTVQLYLLASLVPPRGRIKAKGKQWKPSTSECRDGIFVHVKLPGDVEKAKSEKINFMFDKGLTVQPYMIIVGPSLSNITSAYVIINNNIYKCISVLDALDFCFKSHHVFDAKYSFESHHIWYLIQWLVYDLRTKYDTKIPFIQDCIFK